MGVPVDGKVVRELELYKWRPFAWRLNIWTFAVLYGAWMVFLVPSLDVTDAGFVVGGLILLHILTFLFTAWSVDFRCFVQASRVKDVSEADICKVIPSKFSGSKEVVPLEHKKHVGVGSEGLGSRQLGGSTVAELGFGFRKQRFIYQEEHHRFRKLDYPSKETFGSYMKSTGYGSEAKAQAALEKWGRNIFEFPQPTFRQLMTEHMLEPFFVFQVFCVGLWCLDEYWYHSLFTLFMLILFESTVVNSRLKTLTELRRVRVDTQTLNVHRGGKWVKMSGIDLLPGDVVSIGRPTGAGSEERTVPADMLLIAGSVIANEALLTGESTPQWKGPITGREVGERLSIRRDKNHVLFGGTKILQHTPDKQGSVLKVPDGGCLAVVLRTGFETSQGKLMRTILFSTERVTANNWESGLFILFLVVFAVIAAGYVLKQGLEDPTRSKYKLFLHCTFIITSVIPPELPMELSIAVNTSLLALAKRGIYCTEPFRIPFAGKVDVCCFDKTGTLTSDDMEFRGVAGVEESSEVVDDVTKLPDRAVHVLAACHALVFVENKLVGDPLEKAGLNGIDWSYTADEKAVPRKGSGHPVQILQRHHFASHLKRMAVVARINETFVALVKGAPETLQERLVELPEGYVAKYKHYTRQGARVLALAYKELPDMPVGEARDLERDVVESDLNFAGFAVFACPMRSDSAEVLKELKDSSHDLVMITGDQALTACHVAAQVHIVSRPVLILTLKRGISGPEIFQWISPDEVVTIPFSEEEVYSLSADHDLCIAGDGLEMLQRIDALHDVIPFTKVFARVAPDQKELVMTTLKAAGRVALMCGDGTNDVGALKQAQVGVALLNVVTPSTTGQKSPPGTATGVGKATKKTKSAMNGPASTPPAAPSPSGSGRSPRLGAPPSGQLIASSSGGALQSPTGRPLNAAEIQRMKLQKMVDEMNDDGDGRTAPVVRLGDASMASPFTAKHASVRPTTDIIRQGRSTLVTTLQMFKILGLNCLATAYVLSVMYLDGVKLGDVQATILGVFTAAFFLFISHAKPLNSLSAERPHPNIFSLYVILSLLGQFAIHLTFLIISVRGAKQFMPEECVEPDSEFSPNLVNTVSYMANMMIQVATFAVNYIGHPFNQSIRENRPFYFALTSAFIFFTAITSDKFRNLNDWLRLVPLPQPFGHKLLAYAGAMLVSCYAWEHILRLLFPVKMPSLKPRQRRKAVEGKDKAV